MREIQGTSFPLPDMHLSPDEQSVMARLTGQKFMIEAKGRIVSGGEITPTYILLCMEEMITFETEWENAGVKKDTFTALTQMVAEKSAWGVVSVNDVFAANIKSSEIEKAEREGVKGHPDRYEAIVVAVQTESGYVHTTIHPYHRLDSGQVMWGKITETEKVPEMQNFDPFNLSGKQKA